ncbi:putative alkaline/neutral invertase B [Camellia lanceoleosa]|uniref:Alkaline/neutral invertase B n=1 Tax=Camellia lanceoleosa TaxID=1840588 RepID=A0ACC0HNF6_9ERIC|nr:putative alkaline/neutral invertase B [Camellia lanceoleosa]
MSDSHGLSWFLVGNCIAILSSLATPAQAIAIMDLIEERWEDLIGEMPLKSLTLHWKDTSGGLSLVVIQRILTGVTIIVELGELLTIHLLHTKTTDATGQANKRRSTTSLSRVNPIEVLAHMSAAPSPMMRLRVYVL